MPWLNLWWVLAFGLNVALLVVGRWTPATRWADLAVRLLGAAVLAGMVLGGALTVHPAVTLLFKFALAVACLATLADVGRRLRRLSNAEVVAAQSCGAQGPGA